MIPLESIWLPLSVLFAIFSAGILLLLKGVELRTQVLFNPLSTDLAKAVALALTLTERVRATEQEMERIRSLVEKAAVQLHEQLIEVETQFRGLRELDAVRVGYDTRLMAMLYQKVFDAELPGIVYPPIATAPPRQR